MPHERLSPHALRGIQRAFEQKGRREETKELQRQRQAGKAARKPSAPRRREWDDGHEDEAQPTPGRTAMRPYGEKPQLARPRGRTPMRPYGEGDAAGEGGRGDPPGSPLRGEGDADLGGVVLELRGRDVLVAAKGGTLAARLSPQVLMAAGGRSPLAVGDEVGLRRLSPDLARVVSVAPRRTVLRRHVSVDDLDGASEEHVIAANVDQAVLVCSPASPPFRPGLIDRYLVSAGRDGLPLAVCLNKVDLGVPEDVEAFLEGYAGLGVEVLRTSAVTGQGLRELLDRLSGRVSLLTGHSGVGKSSLLNALEPGLALRVGVVTGTAAGQGKGRHTTSSARLVPLSSAGTPNSGTYVVDSPGIRAFGVGRLAPGELASLFPDVARWADGCAVRRCRHTGEPGCAVEAGLSATAFGRHRLASYRALAREAEG